MKKMKKLTMAVVSMIVFAASATYTGCDSKTEDSAFGLPQSTRFQGWKVIDGKIVAIDNEGNPHDLPDNLLPEVRAERTYKEEGTSPVAALSLAPRQLNTASPATTTTSFPYNYGINNEVTATLWLEWNGVTLRPLDTLFVKGSHQVDNTATGPFVEQSHTQYTLCWADGSTVVISGDSISCRQNFAIREVVPVVVHDTVWRERVIHDTVWRERIIHDTIHHTDTVWQERVVHDTVINGVWVDSVVTRRRAVVNHSHLSTRTTDTYTPITATTGALETHCTNRTDSSFTEKLFIWYSDATVDSLRTRNWSSSRNWQKIWTRSVAIYGTNPGSGRATMSGNVADFGGGFCVILGNPVVTTSPAGYNPNSTNCTHNVTYMVASATGITEKGAVAHGTSADSTQGFIPMSGNPPTPIRIDTSWGNCTTANNGVYNPATERVSFVVHKQYRLDTVFSDNTHGYSAWQTASATYQYMVTRTGQPMLSIINSIPLTIGSDNTATFGGGAFTETLTPVGSQRFCPLTLTSAVLTSNGTVWTGSYGTSTPTVTVTETWATPDPIFDGAVWGYVTDSYVTNLSTTPERWCHIVRQHGSGASATYTWYYAEWQSGLVRADFDSVSITATQFAALQTAITAGRGLAKVYHHSDGGATFELGTVKGIEQTSGRWKVKYYDISGALENMIEFSASTFSSYYGEEPIRGIMNASGVLTADGITMYVF